MNCANRFCISSSLMLMTAITTTGWSQDTADRAVEAAKAYSGLELTVLSEAGLPALDILNFSGPKWRDLTGIDIKLVQMPKTEMLAAILEDHRTGTDKYDVVNVLPTWLPDLVDNGAVLTLDSLIDQFSFHGELDDIVAVYRDDRFGTEDKVYALPDDGNVFLLYYRKDVFAEEGLQPPETWAEFAETARKLTEKYAPEMYGASIVREPALAQLMFQERFRVEGGRFFDRNSMKASLNSDIGVEVLLQMREENQFMPDGIESASYIDNLAVFLAGKSAMTILLPPDGRWLSADANTHEALAWLPKSYIDGNIGYALPPGRQPQIADGYSLSLAAGGRNVEAAYLFIQWLNSPGISLERILLPYALRSPFREHHFTNHRYQSRWPGADKYLQVLRTAADRGLRRLSLLEVERYEIALQNGFSRLWAGEEADAILDDVAMAWDKITGRVGADRQQEVYLDWLSRPNASAK